MYVVCLEQPIAQLINPDGFSQILIACLTLNKTAHSCKLHFMVEVRVGLDAS